MGKLWLKIVSIQIVSL